MRKITAFGGTAALLLLLSHTASAAVFGLTTDRALVPSTVEIQVYLGDPNNGGQFLGTLGTVAVNGSMTADISLDGAGDGTFTSQASALAVDPVGPTTLDLGGFGTVDVVGLGLVLSTVGGPYPVASNVVTAPSGSMIDAGIIGGVLSLTNPTGLLLGIIPDGADFDFDSDPLITTGTFVDATVLGTTDDGAGGISPFAEFNLSGLLAFKIGDFPGTDGFFAGIVSDVHLAAPEPSSFALAGVGIVGLAVLGRRWRRRD